MAVSVPAVQSDDEFLIVEELDLSDETELRRVAGTVESLALAPGAPGLRVSVLTGEQWKTALHRMLPPALRRESAHLYLHTLRDPRDQCHLLVSSSAVEGINEGNPMMYQDLVYACLRCLPSDLPTLLRRGVDNLIAADVGARLGVKLFTRNHLRETHLIVGLIAALSKQFGYSELEWALELRRQPKRCLIALSKTKFAAFWHERTGADPAQLVEILTRSRIRLDDEDMEGIIDALDAYGKKGAKRG